MKKHKIGQNPKAWKEYRKNTLNKVDTVIFQKVQKLPCTLARNASVNSKKTAQK